MYNSIMQGTCVKHFVTEKNHFAITARNSFDEMIDEPRPGHGHNTIALSWLLSHSPGDIIF